MTAEEPILTQEQTVRLAVELVTAAGPDGLTEPELEEAAQELEELAVSAALWAGWVGGALTLAWDRESKELRWFATVPSA